MTMIYFNRIFLMFLAFSFISALDYNPAHTVSCQLIPSDTLQKNLQYLWPRLLLHELDQYIIFATTPIVLILQVILLVNYAKFSTLLTKPGNIFCGILIIEFILNLRLLIQDIYVNVNSQYEPMPNNFESYCMTMGIISAFFVFLHTFYLFIFYVYVIVMFRFSLRKKSKGFWKILHLAVILISILLTIFLWLDDFIGLNYDGLCGIALTRKPRLNVALPSLSLGFALFFTILGIFTYYYFHKHLPKSQGFQRRRYNESKIIGMYVVGFSLYLILIGTFTLITNINCENQSPQPWITVFSTISNCLKILQYYFLIYLIVKNNYFRYKLKKLFRRIFQKKDLRLKQKTTDFQTQFLEMQDLAFNEQLLDIKEASNQVDLLLISQIYTIISCVYISFVEYYSSPKRQQSIEKIKPIHYYEKIVFLVDNSCAVSYDTDIALLSKLKILKCSVTIYAPKIFKNLQLMDGLSNIEQSFRMYENSKKMHNLVEGKGGKSGQFFFFSADNMYVIKTITIQQFDFLLQNLEVFYEYYTRNPFSLLAKIYGLFSIKGDQIQRTYRFILMKNILGCSRQQVIRTYDMKGSKYARQVIKKRIQKYDLQKQTLKDKDFMNLEGKIKITPEISQKFREILREDTLFLKQLNLIDYSLLVVRVQWKDEPKNPNFWSKLQRIPSIEVKNQYYHIGIIDYMQKWDFQKKGQKWWKNLIGKKDISAAEPNLYQNRFMIFVDEITTELPLNEKQIEEVQVQSKRSKQKMIKDEQIN